MSRVHDALRKAETHIKSAPAAPAETSTAIAAPEMPAAPVASAVPVVSVVPVASTAPAAPTTPGLPGFLEQVRMIPWDPAEESHLINLEKPAGSPTEEFRTLRTRLNHMQGLQPLHTLVVTSASPAEGKSFTAANLAMVQAHLQGNLTLLCDFDFRRPIVHQLFKTERSPGLTDYLQGKASLGDVIRRVAETNLYILPAGASVPNPLELLNLKEVKVLLEKLQTLFNWVLLDTPPLLFAADANLLATMCDGTLMVVRLGQTTVDLVTRALQGMSHNNLVGIVANGAKRSELYSKYSYYQSYYYYGHKDENAEGSDGDASSEEQAESAATEQN